MGWKRMDYRMAVEVQTFADIMPVMVVVFDLYFNAFGGLRAINLNITPATTAVPITPIIPATPTDARSFSIPLTP